MLELEEPSQPAHKTQRFALIETNAGAKIMVARITLSGTDEGKFRFELSAEQDDALQRLKPIFDFEAHKDRLPSLATMDEAANHISEMAQAGGYTLEALPDGDFTFDLYLDTKSGRMISSQSALHPHASAPERMAHDMHSALAGMFEGIPTKIANAINAAVAMGDYQKAAAELEVAATEGKLYLPPNEQLLDAIKTIDLSGLSNEQVRGVRECMMITAQRLGHMDIASEQAEVLLQEPGMTPVQMADLELMIAHAAMKRGQVDTAMSIWRRLLDHPNSSNLRPGHGPGVILP